jgi:hypothetical protein
LSLSQIEHRYLLLLRLARHAPGHLLATATV